MIIKNIEEVIKQRSATRDYDKQWQGQQVLGKVLKYVEEINTTKGPFGTTIKIHYINKNITESIKLGTYGVISGANNYLVVSVNKKNYNLLDLGYLFEEVVLYIVSLGLSANWMAGTYSKKDFKKAIELVDNEEVAVICPFGKKIDKNTLLSKVKHKPKKRRDFGDLFFNLDLTPLEEQASLNYIRALQMVRLAPSSLNKQHWRIVVDKVKKQYHFYSAIEKRGSDINIGIAVAHFELTMNELGVQGKLVQVENKILPNYKCTWEEI